MKLQHKFDGIMKGFITQRNKLLGLQKQVVEEHESKLREAAEAEMNAAALAGLGNRIQTSVDELTTIIGDK